MEKILGNFTTQTGRDFPLDCETLDNIQTLAQMAALVGNLGGDKVILSGCETVFYPAQWLPGYVFVRTKAAPDGEVLHFSGGNGMRCYVKESYTAVEANGVAYPRAYSTRELVSVPDSADAEGWDWTEFVRVKPLRELMAAVDSVRQVPVGGIVIWAGSKVPSGYLLCDGSAVFASDYPELFAALGHTYDNALDYNGEDPGAIAITRFRVPDLRGRFVMGCTDMLTPGHTGGAAEVALTEAQLPTHKHDVDDFAGTFVSARSGISSKGAPSGYPTGTVNVEGRVVQPEMVDWSVKSASFLPVVSTNMDDMVNTNTTSAYLQAVPHTTKSAGLGAVHENRPPYYTLAYIIRAK